MPCRASFHKEEEGFEHQNDLPTGIPDPEELEPFVWDGFPVDDQGRMIRPIELRYVTGSPAERGQSREPRLQVWLRATGTLPGDPVLHTCMFTYASDMTVLDTATKALPVRGNEIDIQAASLDHAMWFHRPAAHGRLDLFGPGVQLGVQRPGVGVGHGVEPHR